MKMFVIRLCRMIAAAGAVFICAMPMVLYADSYGDRVKGQESVLFRISGEDEDDKHTQEVRVTVLANIVPSPSVTAIPTRVPTTLPTRTPTVVPAVIPTKEPSSVPTMIPTRVPTSVPTLTPTTDPTEVPTVVPTLVPTGTPTTQPTKSPTSTPTPVPTIIHSTTTIVKPVVTTVPVYIPHITTIPMPYESKTPVPTTVILPGSGYIGGSSSVTPTVTKEPFKKEHSDDGKGDGEPVQELIIVQMQENRAVQEDISAGIEVSEKEEPEGEKETAPGNVLMVSGNVIAKDQRMPEETEAEAPFYMKLLRFLLRVLVVIAVLGVAAGLYYLGAYLGWWVPVWLPFFVKDDEDDEERDEEQENYMEGMESAEISEWSDEEGQEDGRVLQTKQTPEEDQDCDPWQEQEDMTEQNTEKEGNNE